MHNDTLTISNQLIEEDMTMKRIFHENLTYDDNYYGPEPKGNVTVHQYADGKRYKLDVHDEDNSLVYREVVDDISELLKRLHFDVYNGTTNCD